MDFGIQQPALGAVWGDTLDKKIWMMSGKI